MRQRIILAATCTVLACTGGDVPLDAGTDVGMDASAIDAAPDASEAATDANPDAWLAPDDPGWVRLPGFPDDCYVERARQPQAVLAYHWEPCLDSLPACEMAVLDRSVAPLDRPFVINGGNDMRGVIAWHLLSTDRSYVVFARDDLVAVAWRDAGIVNHIACLANAVASAAGTAIDAGFLREDGTGADYVSTAAWNALATLDSPLWTSSTDLIPAGSFLETPSTSDTTFAGTLTNGAILAVEPPTAAILGHGDLNPVVVGHTVLWNWGDASGATGIHVSRIGGTETELYRAPAGTDMVGVRADGTWITWRAETIGASPPFNELWAAPYTETPPLAPRRLWTDLMLNGFNGTIGDGMFVYTGPDPTGTMPAIKVVNLADGSRREYLLPPPSTSGDGWHFTTDAAWVTRDEVAMPAGRIAGTDRLLTVLRVDLRGLPVEPPP